MLELTYVLKNNDNNKITTTQTDENVSIEIIEANNRVTIKLKALNDIVLYKAKYDSNVKFNEKSKFFLNGYQSWTDTKEAYIDEYERIARRAERFFKTFHERETFEKTKDPLLNRFAFDRYGDVLFYEYNKNKLHGYDIFYIKGDNEFFSINYNYKNTFLVYEVYRKEMTLSMTAGIKKYPMKKDEEFTLFDFSSFDNVDLGLKDFYNTFKEIKGNKIIGYTSWYNYYQNINEEIILRDLEGLDNRFNLFQIDDGYEAFVGDWLNIDKNKFPNGFNDIVNKIHNKGFKAGIWLAPFVAEEKSDLYQNHKELFKKDSHGNFIKCGGNWSGFYLLDIDNKDTLDYIRKCLEYYMDMGFDFFKLDFLYAVSLPRYYDKTKAMATDNAYKFLREVLKDKLILGCGAIPFSSYTYFDYLRVGPDVSLQFDDVWFMRLAHRERISTKVTLQNTIYRSIFNNHLFLNDPDVFLLRSDNIKLSHKQKESLLIINALFGSVLMTSDNLSSYDEKTKELLDYALDLYNNASDIKYERDKEYILISCKWNDKTLNYKYNTKKGVLDKC